MGSAETMRHLKGKKAVQNFAMSLCDLYMSDPDAVYEDDVWVDEDGNITRGDAE